MPSNFASLDHVLKAAEAAIPDALLRSIVITRIFVRTGVNLREVRPEQKSDSTIVSEIARTFEELGYSLGGES